MSAGLVVPLEDPAATQAALVGGKSSALAGLLSAGAPVPRGFAVTVQAYDTFLSRDGLERRVGAILAAHGDGGVSGDQLAEREVRAIFAERPLPKDACDAIANGYLNLCRSQGSVNDLPVAVRSSATAEDLADASFAGQQDSHLWVVGVDAMLDRVRDCWASLFSARALAYRRHRGIDHLGVRMGVLVQKMVDAQTAGVAMTLDPVTGDRSCIVIEASWGIGESVVSGEVTPDCFKLDKIMLGIISRQLGAKATEIIPDLQARTTRRWQVPPERQMCYCLHDGQVQTIARLAKQLEARSGAPLDLEWAIERAGGVEGGRLALLQCRPETVWSLRRSDGRPYAPGVNGLVQSLLKPMGLMPGAPASPIPMTLPSDRE
jgi:pyruvate,water dikinase